MAPPPRFAGTAGASTVQMGRSKVNRRGNGTISGVSFKTTGKKRQAYRPVSNCRAKQGQHLTAFVTFRDEIEQVVRNATVSGAATNLRDYLRTIKRLPGMRGNPPHIRTAIRNSKAALAGLGNTAQDATTLGDQIDQALAIRNQVPRTAMVLTNTGGHGEAQSSGILVDLDRFLAGNPTALDWTNKGWHQATVSNQARHLMWRLLDYNPAAPANQAALDQIGDDVVTHFRSLVRAYPNVDNWLNGRGEYLFAYLTANHGHAEMPLGKLSLAEIGQVQVYVGTNL